METVAVVASIVTGVLTATATVAIVAFRLSQHAQRYTAQRAIGDLQSSLAVTSGDVVLEGGDRC